MAMETAKVIDRPECWERLALQALKQGNHKVGNCLLSSFNILTSFRRSSRKLINKRKISIGSLFSTSRLVVPTNCRKCKSLPIHVGIQCRGSTTHYMPEMSKAVSLS